MPAANHAPVDIPDPDAHPRDEVSSDGERLRAVMRHLASPVTIVTVEADGERRGATIGSFTSLSLEPPLVSFNAIRGTNFHGALSRAKQFAVHLLREDQVDLAEHFALPDLEPDEQFAIVPLRDGQDGPPVVDDVLAVVHCERWKTVPAGDHDLIIGRVLDVETKPGDSGPLLYYGRSYRGVGEEA